MSEEYVANLRPTDSITNLPITRYSTKLKSKPIKDVPSESACSAMDGGFKLSNAFPKYDLPAQNPQKCSFASSRLLNEDLNKSKSPRQLRAKLPWLDGKPSSQASDEKVRDLHLPGAFEFESPKSSSEHSSKDVNIHLTRLNQPLKTDFGMNGTNIQGRAPLPWIKRPDGSSPTLSSTNISPSTPMVRNWRNTKINEEGNSIRYESSASSTASPEIMSVPIDVRKLESNAIDISTEKTMPVEESYSSSTPSSSDYSVVRSPNYNQIQLPHTVDIYDRVTGQSVPSLDNVKKEEPVKVIDFVQGVNEIYRKAPNIKESPKLAFIDPTPISDASSLSSSLAYDLTSAASIDVEMQSSIRQSVHPFSRPNFSNQDILRSPDIRLGESARSFRRKSGLAAPGSMPQGETFSQRTFLQGQSAKRVSFHPNLPFQIQPAESQESENHGVGQSDLLGKSDIRRRHGKHASIQTPPRSSSLKNLDAAQKDAAADASAHKYGEAGDGMDRADLGQRQYHEDGGHGYPNEEVTGVTVHREKPSHRDTGFSFRRYKHRPVARNWKNQRKRVVAAVACFNTGLIGYIVGIYAGEVPRIQYQLGDENNFTIQGNVVLYLSIALSTLLFWPLPLLHGRKPYILGALSVVLPLQFPQAISVGSPRMPDQAIFRIGLLLPRALSGFVLGFANVNSITMLFDLFGVSLQSQRPHQELVYVNDPRRHGGGLGIWLGIWSWCFIASLSIGFLTGAGIIARLDPAWGFYVATILLAIMLLLNIIVPETRRAMYRQAVAELKDEHDRPARVRARGEIKLHISADGPEFWFEEVFAGIKLSMRMLSQFGFAVLAIYLGWIYAQIVLAQILLGALLSREYNFYPQYVGLGVFSIALGALLAVPLSRASLFSRSRSHGPRTNSMTIEARVTWTSHLFRRILFTLTLPFVALGYTLVSIGEEIPFILPCLFAGAIGFLSNLATSECYGLLMETFDTSDLQPGVNSRHRLQSMATITRRRRTNYSSFPRVSAGVFVSQSFAFVFAAIATAVGGVLTRGLGAQAATGVFAGILLFLTLLLTLVLWRFKEVQVIPTHLSAHRRQSEEGFEEMRDEYWQPVIIGNPSGKTRRMNLLEMGSLSRWTEIRRLNKLIQDDGALFY